MRAIEIGGEFLTYWTGDTRKGGRERKGAVSELVESVVWKYRCIFFSHSGRLGWGEATWSVHLS